MKYVKILGLAAIAAAALMAFVGASSASATMLYKNAGHTETLAKGATIEAEVEGTATLKAGFAEVKCTKGFVNGTIENPGGSGVEVSGEITKLEFVNSSCNCEVVTLKNGKLSLGGTGPNGTVSGTGSEVTVNCFGTDCVYGTGAGTTLGTLTGSSTTGKTATLDISASITKISGGVFCASPATWTANYVVTNPDTLEITGT